MTQLYRRVDRAVPKLAGSIADDVREWIEAVLVGEQTPATERIADAVRRWVSRVTWLGAASAADRARKARPVAFAADPASSLVSLVISPDQDAAASLLAAFPELQGLAAPVRAITDSTTERFIAGLLRRITRVADDVATAGGATLTRASVRSAVEVTLGRRDIVRMLDTDTRTALMLGFNRGQAERLLQESDLFPVWTLDEIRDARTRGNPRGLYPDAGPHYEMDGFSAAATDPVWRIITPPNGYNCRASITPVSIDEAQRKGWMTTIGGVEVVDSSKLRRIFARQWGYIERGRYPDPGWGE